VETDVEEGAVAAGSEGFGVLGWIGDDAGDTEIAEDLVGLAAEPGNVTRLNGDGAVGMLAADGLRKTGARSGSNACEGGS